ncbi:MAG: flavin reductase family protein [Anaerolineales bacterium]|jgi:flavin reductase (DIM6/NTAB) family NADH-FMN oxidoreductase RutF
MPDLGQSLRLAMRRWSSGITIVTAQHDGHRHGMTVSSFTSVSLQPPIVLVCIDRAARTHDLIQNSGQFAACILHRDQQQLSDRFAGRLADVSDRFEGIDVETTPSGLSVPAGYLACMDCRLVASHMLSRSTVFLAEVDWVKLGPEGPPLLYYNQNYRFLDL